MVDLLRKVKAEKENVAEALGNLEEATARKDKTTIELAATATFLHNIYNGIENILKQIVKAKGADIPESKTWHKDLLELSVSLGIIPGELADELYEYLTFRHFFVHSYGFMLEETHLANLTANIQDIWSQFLRAIDVHCRALDNTS